MNKRTNIAITLCALAGGLSVAEAQVMCGDTITTPEVLTADLSCGFGGGAGVIRVQGPGGSLDLRGFTISCENDGSFALELTGSGAVVQNGTVTSCDIGVGVEGNGHRVQRVIARFNEDGLSVSGSGNRILQNNVRDNAIEGIRIEGSANLVRDNILSNNNIDALGSGNKYGDNMVVGSGFTIRGNNDVFVRNVARDGAQGFTVQGDNNVLTANRAENNFDDGIDVAAGATGNKLKRNSGSGNGTAASEPGGGFDLEDDNPNCDSNSWRQNTGTRNQTCIQ